MNAIEHRITAAVVDLLNENRPLGPPDNFPIRAEQDIGKLERPYLVVSVEDAGAPHPLLRKMTLTLTTVRRADDDATSPPLELHQRFVNALEENLPDLGSALEGMQLRLRKILPGVTGEEIVAGRGESSSASWGVWVQIL
jgi:hypothetical protein